MEIIKVVDIISTKSAISPKTGLRAYNVVSQKIQNNEDINISFEDVEDLTSAFCNSFIGKLYMNFDFQKLNKSLVITGVEESHIWFKKIKNAILLGDK
jgi:hypothetical protein